MSDIVVDSLVTVARKPSMAVLEKWRNTWVSHMDRHVGDGIVYKVTFIDGSNVIISDAITGEGTGYIWPIEAFELHHGEVKAPETFNNGDFVRIKDELASEDEKGSIYRVINNSITTPRAVHCQLVQVKKRSEGSPVDSNRTEFIVSTFRLTKTKKPSRYSKNIAKNIAVNDIVKVGGKFGIVTIIGGTKLVFAADMFDDHGGTRSTVYIADQAEVIVRGVVVRRSPEQREKIKRKFKEQMNVVRYGNLPNLDYRIRNRLEYRLIGKLVAKTLASGDVDSYDLVKILNEAKANLLSNALAEVQDKFEEYHGNAMNYVGECDDCGVYELREDMSYANDNLICSSCIEDHYYWSTRMDRYIHRADACNYYETESDYNRHEPAYITYSYGSRSDDIYEYDGDFFSEDAYYDLGFYDEDQDERTNSDGLMGYHSSNRRFIEQGGTTQYPPLGVEIEVYSDDRRESVRKLREHYGHDELYLEQDGSLDDEYGFEIITQPYGKELWKTHSSHILDALTSTGAVAFNHPDEDNSYGIHININRQYLSPLQEARMFMFLAASENSNFVKAIAQRQSIYSARVDLGSTTKRNQKVSTIGGLEVRRRNGKNIKKVMGAGKYCPINFRENIAEIRIFQSTLLETSFNKNLEFVWALMEWTRPSSATGSGWNHVEFIKWLCTRQHVEKDYPNLMAYLRKPKYVVKFCDSPVRSTWADLMRPAVRSSLVIETDELIKEAA